MKTIAIFYFSGTGNTEIVANMLKEDFFKQEYNVDMIKIEDVLKNNLKFDIDKYDLIGIGSQVIGYGSPNIVHDFIKKLPNENGKKVFIFRTAGGVAPINYNTSKSIMRSLKIKGYEVFYERIFAISSNWIIKYSDKIIKQLHEATRKKVSIMCEEVIRGEDRILKSSLGLKICMEVAAFIFRPVFKYLGKDLKVDKSCINCGLCIKNCPVNNIYEKNGKIKFKLNCNSCMRCVYSCPKNAINYRMLKFFAVPGGYNIKKILSQQVNCNEEKNENIPAFFNNYINDDNL